MPSTKTKKWFCCPSLQQCLHNWHAIWLNLTGKDSREIFCAYILFGKEVWRHAVSECLHDNTVVAYFFVILAQRKGWFLKEGIGWKKTAWCISKITGEWFLDSEMTKRDKSTFVCR